MGLSVTALTDEDNADLFGLNAFIPSCLDMKTKIIYKNRKCRDFLRIRLLMDTIHERTLHEIKMLRNSLICSKHKVFNKPCCRISLTHHYICRISVRIKKNF